MKHWTKWNELSLYYLMLAEYNLNRFYFEKYGLCLLGQIASCNRWGYNISAHSPLLFSKGPRAIRSFRYFWFPRNKAGWKKRIALLEECISELETELYK